MSLFRIPKGVIERIESLIRKFLWGGSDGKRKIHWVNWESVIIPKNYGGLGIADLELKNNALLVKWLWRFGNEDDSLWKRVIVARQLNSHIGLLPQAPSRGTASFVWRNIVRCLEPSNRWSLFTKSGLGLSLGDGSKITFWEDVWIGDCSLREAFPRIYALSVNKTGKINDFGDWEHHKWNWRIDLRRPVFDWEKSQWLSFLSLVNEQFPNQFGKDKVIWRASTSGIFSISSYCSSVYSTRYVKNSLWSMVWAGLAPPKVEFFCWQVMKNRIAVKAELCRRGLIVESAASCTFCKTDLETVSHLLFHCPFAWKVWTFSLGMVNLSWCCPGSPDSFLQSWIGMTHCSFDNQWHMVFFVIIWSLWLFRNQMVFQNQEWDFLQVISIIKLRFAMWFKAKWPASVTPIADLYRFPDLATVPAPLKKSRRVMSWSKPPPGSMKFNVDGSAFGKPGLAGVGGVLRDCEGNVKASFSKPIGIEDSNTAEFLAIREGFRIFVSSCWNSSHSLIIESDSLNAVCWCLNPDKVPWRLHMFSNHIQSLQKKLQNWKCYHIMREANADADKLAKEGATRENEDVSFFI